jgi:[CysO sulfur-carrier protein]-S-L-cysteine hydrolase
VTDPSADPRADPAGAAAAPAAHQGGAVHLPPHVVDEMVAHCLGALPEEGCGLLAGDPATNRVERCHPTRNAVSSAKRYVVDPQDHLRVDREAEAAGLEIVGVFHSHTHTDAYPSPTDVAEAPDPTWHYVLVSLRHEVPAVRSYRIAEGRIEEEPVVTTEPRR